MQIETAKKYVVEVYSDKGPLGASPWNFIGEFNNASQATEACKRIVDDFLHKSLERGLGARDLENLFLRHGDIPYINCGENLGIFDIYEYLNMRCTQFNCQIPSLL